MSPTEREERLLSLYRAFTSRDVAAVLAAPTPDADRPDGWEGGRLAGHDAVRAYWQRRWAGIRPVVPPTTFAERPDGTAEVGVRQVVRDPAGTVLERVDVRHVYAFDGDLVRRVDVER